MSGALAWSWAARRNDVLVTLWLCLNIGFSWWAAPQAQIVWASQFCAMGVFLLHRAFCEQRGQNALQGWYGLVWLALAVVTCALLWRVEGGSLLLPRGLLPFVFLALVSSPNLQVRMGWALSLGALILFFYSFLGTPSNEAGGNDWAVPLMIALNIGFLLFFGFTQRQAFASAPSQSTTATPGAGWAMAASLGVALGSLVLAWPLALARQALRTVEFPSIGNLPSISTSSKPVFRAAFSGPSPSQPYWRAADAYAFPTGESSWETFYPSITKEASSNPMKKSLLQADLMASYQVPVGKEEYLYRSADLGDTWLEGVFETKTEGGDVNGQGPVWRMRKAYKHFAYKVFDGFTPALDSAYLSIPDFDRPNTFQSVSLDGAKERMPKTWALVQGWKKEGLSDEQLANRALDYFKANLAYHFDHQSMDPEKNRVDYFLFEDKKGVCRHFANAFAMMMRMGGVRSRVVGGYMGGQFDELTNTWTVRARDAHAWTEIWLEGRGWVRVDPTAVVPVEKGVPQDSKSWLSSWFSGQSKSSAKIGQQFSTSGEANEEKGVGLPALGPWSRPVMVGILGLMALATLVLWWRFARLRHHATAVPPEQRQWDKLMAVLRGKGVKLQPSQGPATIGKLFAPSLPAQERAAWLETVRAYEQWKFGQVASPGLSKALARWRKAIKAQKP